MLEVPCTPISLKKPSAFSGNCSVSTNLFPLCYNPLMRRAKACFDKVHVVLSVSVAVLALYAALLTAQVFEMNKYSENRDDFIMEQVFELQVDKFNREAQEQGFS